MVFIPRDTTLPLEPIVQPFAGLAILRRQTRWFISLDPVEIILTPTARVEAPGGAWNVQNLPPRPAQIFKLIHQTGSNGVIDTADGHNIRHEFVMLGEWDAVVDIGDTFTDPAGTDQKWVVNGLLPYNGYEVKATAVTYGKNVRHG